MIQKSVIADLNIILEQRQPAIECHSNVLRNERPGYY